MREHPVATRARVVVAIALALVLAVLASTVGMPSTASAACPPASGSAFTAAPVPSPPAQVVFRGFGWGHGVGMSQYGAQGAARLGCSAAQILTTYYTGTSIATRTDRTSISVRMLDDVRQASVTTVSGRFSWFNGGTLVATQTGGAYRVRWLSATTLELVTGGRRVWSGTVHPDGLVAAIKQSIVSLNGKVDTYGKLPMRLRYDDIQFVAHAGGMDVIKRFRDSGTRALDKYLFGLAEVPSSWPVEALRAQAIAARTFAYQKNTILRPTPSDQNYSGYDQEERDLANGGRLRQAVLDTSGRIVVDGAGRAITAFYSSSMAGYTEDIRYSFGGPEVPYLKPVNDARWDRASDNPEHLRRWAIGKSRAQVATALGFDTITSISVPRRGRSDRIEGVRVVGTRNGRSVTEFFRGFTVDLALGLLSPGFTVTMTNP